MNREQYQAKCMWLHGALPGDGNECPHGSQGADETSSPPTASSFSLADYYLGFHSGARDSKESLPS